MAAWDLLASPKCVGGLGFTDTRVMNRCLLAKWIFKLESNVDNVCCNLLRAKYLGERGFFSCDSNSCSQFWRGLLEVKEWCSRGLVYLLGGGKKIRFWYDVWVGGCPLNLVFPNIFDICNQQEGTVHRILSNISTNLTFRRSFGLVEQNEFLELLQILEGVSLSDGKGSVKWILEKSGVFCTSSMYRELTFTGCTNRWLMCVWRSKLPLKIRIFLKQVFNNKIQSAEQLKVRNWPGSVECKMCGVPESTDHLLFRCAVPQFTWCIFRDVLGWVFVPLSANDLNVLCRDMSNNQTQRLFFLFGCVLWSLWL